SLNKTGGQHMHTRRAVDPFETAKRGPWPSLGRTRYRATDGYSSGVLTSASSCSSAAAASSAAALASRPAGLATEAPGLVAVAYPPAQFKLSRTSSVTDCT